MRKGMDKMISACLLVGCLALGAWRVARGQENPPQAARPGEQWNALTMEASAVLGEAYYKDNDLDQAKDKFRDSLGASMKVYRPQPDIVAMDLYRTAEIELKHRNFSEAKKHLDVLLSRYSGSIWAEEARRMLLLMLPNPSREEPVEEPVQTLGEDAEPELLLQRLQAALRDGKDAQSLGFCEEFMNRFPAHSMVSEVRLAHGAVLLGSGEFRRAAEALKISADGDGDGASHSKARYLLGVAYLSLGDGEALRRRVPSVEPAETADRWLALAQAWRPASASRLAGVLELRYNSPAKAYAAAALGAELGRRGEIDRAADSMRRAAEEADRWDIADLGRYARWAIAELRYKGRSYPEAASAYEMFVRRYPDDPQSVLAVYQGAMAQKWAGKWRQAVAGFERVIQRYPDSEESSAAYLQLGQIYSNRGLTEQALAAYKRLRGASAENADRESLLLMAQVHYNHKRFEEAIALYEDFLNRFPQDARAYEVAELLLNAHWMGGRDEAQLRILVERFPRHPIVARIRWELGSREMRGKNYLQAERHFRRIVDDFPKSNYAVRSLFHQAECLVKLRDLAGAAEAYQRLLARHPKSPYGRQASLRQAQILYEQEDFTRAAQLFSRIGGRDARAQEAMFFGALSYEKSGDRAEAVSAYRRFLAQFPKNRRVPLAWYQLGKALESSNRFLEAARAYARVAPRAPERPQALLAAGRCQEKLRDVGAARETYEELRRWASLDDPSRLRGLLRLAILSERRAPREAISLYGEVLRRAKDEAVQGVARRRLQVLRAQAA
ncbi:MAG: tetratricopeptide repeat protein [Elusimicrobia bacterium]|nr:tetratricopeptide repeat protein [Elusimicrobiota bacterium]